MFFIQLSEHAYADNSKILDFKTSWQKMVEKYLEQLVGFPPLRNGQIQKLMCLTRLTNSPRAIRRCRFQRENHELHTGLW